MSNNKKVTYKSSFTSKIINKKNLSKENLIKENDFNKFFKPILDMELIETDEISIVKDELLTLGFFKVANGRSSWSQAMIELDSITFNETLPKLQKKYPEQLIEVVSDSGKISYEFYNNNGDSIGIDFNFPNLSNRRLQAKLRKQAQQLEKSK
tara:strand:+ start:35 stop:493 length:459 start_codon:yes stop_codon:yes gene_type:complete